VVEEELCEQAQALTVLLVTLAADFKDGDRFFPVDLVAWWMVPNALGRVSLQLGCRSVVLQAELANVNLRQGANVVWVGALVPHFHFEASHFEVSRLLRVRQAAHGVLHDLAGLSLSLAEDLQVPLRSESMLFNKGKKKH